MNEILFKLKKDGKIVGYMKFEGAKPLYQKHPFSEWLNNNNFTPLLCLLGITDLSIHPFVTKDKHSKDVFAGDKVKSGKRVLTIVWDKDCLQWRAGEEDNPYFAPLSQWAISEQFELVEDK